VAAAARTIRVPVHNRVNDEAIRTALAIRVPRASVCPERDRWSTNRAKPDRRQHGGLSRYPVLRGILAASSRLTAGVALD
jgi:hypothetical protein